MNETQPPIRPLRSAGAVFVGLLAVVILSLATDAVLHATGVFPHWGKPMPDWLFLLAMAYRVLYGVVGGYLAALLAPHRPIAHALALGLVGLVISVTGAAVTWNKGPEFGPHWYPVALVVLAVPNAWLGGVLYRRKQAAA
jgi:hypothetical protein